MESMYPSRAVRKSGSYPVVSSQVATPPDEQVCFLLGFCPLYPLWKQKVDVIIIGILMCNEGSGAIIYFPKWKKFLYFWL